MNSKILSILKKVVAISLLLILFSFSSVNAFSFNFRPSFENINYTNHFGFFNSIIEKILTPEDYMLKNSQKELEKMKNSGNYDINRINSIITQLPDGENKAILEAIKNISLKLKEITGQINIGELLDKLIDAIKSMLGNNSSSSSSLPVNGKSVTLSSLTAAKFAGEDYNVKLHATIYRHVDENGNQDSDKWVILIHPFMLKGETIAKKIGPYYYEKGYNIIAPDLRSFGESEGEVALGFLESLDIYDWLTAINNAYNPSEVIIHGISLGGATTNFLSGIDGFLNNGPTKIDSNIKSLRELKVVGLVEDCGYTDMTQFANKNFLLRMNIGLNEENFDYYSNATNSLKYCDIPMLIIHGTKDTTVKPENAEIVKNTVKGNVDYWSVEGGVHAFIIMGIKADEYKAHVQEFIDKI